MEIEDTPESIHAPIYEPNDPEKFPPDWQPPEDEVWSVPPVLTDENYSVNDGAIRLRQGIVTEVRLDGEYLFQNVNENEDDIIDFSLHGNPDGIWGKLNTHAFVRVNTTIYFLNRTHKDVLYMATFKQNTD